MPENILIVHLIWGTPKNDATEIDILTREWPYQRPPTAEELHLMIRLEFVYLERHLNGFALKSHIAHIRSAVTGEEIIPHATA